MWPAKENERKKKKRRGKEKKEMKNIRTITELANVAEFNIKSPRLHLRESMCMRHGCVHVSISTACLSEKGRALHS